MPWVSCSPQKLQAAAQLLEATDDVTLCRHLVALIGDIHQALGQAGSHLP